MPLEDVGEHFRPLMGRQPPLHELRVEIDDPVLRHVPLIHRTLTDAIVPAAGWRDDLDRQKRLAHREPVASYAARLPERHDEYARATAALVLHSSFPLWAGSVTA